ncbi:MAG: hypothetical protein ACJ735_01700 [Actinomycetes bacterium]
MATVGFVRSESIDVNASREQVFALVRALPEVSDEGGRASVHLVSSASPHRCVLECHDGQAAYRWTFDLTTSPTGTTVHQTVERLAAPGLARMLQPFKWELSQCGQVRAFLQHLKREAERPRIPQPRQETAAAEHSVS